MQAATQDDTTPYRQHDSSFAANPIGDLFRDYAEEYIRAYRPSLRHIKLIRAIRICKTPYLGGKRIACKTCNHSHYIYFSCGHSHCPICQSIKREQWIDKLRRDLYAVPYVHVIFTLPHELHGLARSNPKVIYSLIMRSSWQAVKKTTADPSNVGALPGMISVLHTFGSDMKAMSWDPYPSLRRARAQSSDLRGYR